MRLSKRKTFVFPVPNDPDKGEVTLRHILPGEVEDIQEEIGAFETIMKTGEDGKLAPELRQNGSLGDKRYLFQQKAIESWKNIKDADGQDIPCTPENIVLVCREAEIVVTRGGGVKETITFAAWVTECRADAAKQVKSAREASEKN